MGCAKRFLNFRWEHHSWRPRVVSSDTLATKETNMWGRPVEGTSVRCVKQQVCEVCAKTRNDKFCMCDPATADRCAIRLAWRDAQP